VEYRGNHANYLGECGRTLLGNGDKHLERLFEYGQYDGVE
jgi:hypothetical protein